MIHVPYVIKQSEDCLIGDIEKFMELFEEGYFFEQYNRLHLEALKTLEKM